MKQKIFDIANTRGYEIIAIETGIDHMHFLLSYDTADRVCDIVKIVKQETTCHLWQKYSSVLSKQIHTNPKVEICAFKNGEWLRIAGELVEDDRREAKQSMLNAYPSLQKMYSADDGNTEVFYFKNATATFYS